MCACAHMMHRGIYGYTQGGQKRASDPLNLELLAFVTPTATQTVGAGTLSLVLMIVQQVLHSWAIPQAPKRAILERNHVLSLTISRHQVQHLANISKMAFFLLGDLLENKFFDLSSPLSLNIFIESATPSSACKSRPCRYRLWPTLFAVVSHFDFLRVWIPTHTFHPACSLV